MILTLIVALMGDGEPVVQRRAQQVLLERRAYRCLMRHLDEVRLASGKVVIDLTTCPPSLVQGSYPVPPGERILPLTVPELKCLRQASRPNMGIADFSRPGKVALYLSPCGGRR